MDFFRSHVLYNSLFLFSGISGRWEGDDESLYAMESCLLSKVLVSLDYLSFVNQFITYSYTGNTTGPKHKS